MREDNHNYANSTAEFSCNLIQAYVDDALLIANSAEQLQKLINDANFFIHL
jgi:hypothetical protein